MPSPLAVMLSVPPLMAIQPCSGSSAFVVFKPSFCASMVIVPPQIPMLSLPFMPLLAAVTEMVPSVIFKSSRQTMPFAALPVTVKAPLPLMVNLSSVKRAAVSPSVVTFEFAPSERKFSVLAAKERMVRFSFSQDNAAPLELVMETPSKYSFTFSLPVTRI